MFNRIFFALSLYVVSPWASAAELLPWKTYLAVVMGIALICGTILSIRSKKAESRAAKILLAGLYFWVVTFVELVVLALIYQLTH